MSKWYFHHFDINDETGVICPDGTELVIRKTDFTSVSMAKLFEKMASSLVEKETEQKYDDTLLPFLAMMRAELHANVGKGDRPGWLQMDRNTALLEIYYHLAKLQKAVKHDNEPEIREFGADVANMTMMLLDVCGVLTNTSNNPPTGETK